jgi:glycosyltransferase involved in cell wall biosynthesis
MFCCAARYSAPSEAAPVSAHPLLIVMPTLARGGAERHSVWLATQCDRRCWHPHVLAFADGPLRGELIAAGVPVEVLDVSEVGRSSTGADAVWRALRQLRPTLVTGQHIRVEVAIRLALQRLPSAERPPYLAWKHTYDNLGYRLVRERLFERVTGGVVTRYGAVCHTQARHLSRGLGIPSRKISVLPNAVPVPRPAPPPPGGAPTVLMAASMRADKDHATLLRAWPAVLSQHPCARLRLAGDGPLRGELARLATGLGIASQVEFSGCATTSGGCSPRRTYSCSPPTRWSASPTPCWRRWRPGAVWCPPTSPDFPNWSTTG